MNEDEIGIGELKRPGDLVSGRFESDQDKRQADEPGENPGDEGETAAKNACAGSGRRAE